MPQIPPGSPGGIFSTPAGGGKPSPGRGWQGEALTGVGRYEPGPGTAPLPAPGGVPFIRGYCGRQVVSPHPSRALPVPPSPWGKATSGGGCPGGKPSPGRGWTGRSPGRVWGGTGSDPVPPLFRPCGATFPQGKVRGFLPSAFSSAPRFFRSPPLMLPGNRTSVPAGGNGSGGGRWSGRRGPRCSPGSRAPR